MSKGEQNHFHLGRTLTWTKLHETRTKKDYRKKWKRTLGKQMRIVCIEDAALEKEMAAHSSVLAWRILGTAEPGGLPSMGSHRIGRDWSDAAAAAAPAPKCFGTCSSSYVWDRNSNLWWLSNYLIGLMWVLNIRHDTIESLAQCLMDIKDWHTSDILWVGFQTTRINRVTQIFLVSQYYMLCLHFTVVH